MKTNLLNIASVFTLCVGLNSANAADVISKDGKPIQASWRVAMNACPEGQRLPTARELAGWAQARGAKGILEVSQVNPQSIPDGYRLISVIDPNGQADSFYYNYEGFLLTVDGSDKFDFWSSSAKADFEHDAAIISYFGLIHTYPKSGYANVLCVP